MIAPCLVARDKAARDEIHFAPVQVGDAQDHDKDGNPTRRRSHFRRPSQFRSRHFRLHTDLPPADARALLRRLEKVVENISAYWRRPLQGRIVCYVVNDMANWENDRLPHPLGRVFVDGVGGATVGTFVRERNKREYKAVIYANDRPGIAEHETIHAFCLHTFGTCGPEWYKEGMAEMAQYSPNTKAVSCPQHVIDLLRAEPPSSLNDVIKNVKFSEPIAESVMRHADQGRTFTHSAWNREDRGRVREANRSYYWSWSLCHFLYHNPNFSRRFRELGIGQLSGQPIDLAAVYDAMAPELQFEYQFFIKNMANGYRVDLCCWDWSTSASHLHSGASVQTVVQASRGYQPTGLAVRSGERYAYRTQGTWSALSESEPCDADGEDDGRGKLVAVLMRDYRLGRPLELGTQGSIDVPSDGVLFLRCRDRWHELADNHGSLTVQLTRKR